MTNERKHRIETVLSKRQNDITVVLENVFDPHNISAIMRNCDAVGIHEIFVLNTKLPQHEKWGFKSSRSAIKWVTVHQFSNAEQCIARVRTRYQHILATHLSSDAVELYDVDLTGSLAIVFGNEQNGISNELKDLADGNFVIPQVGMLHSLNISVACAVTLYEAFRQKTAAGHYAKPKLAAPELEQLKNEWKFSNESNV